MVGYEKMSSLSPGSLPLDLQGFKPSCITVIEGSSGIVPAVLFRLCALAAVSGRDAIFLDGWNSFNPYAVSGIARSFGAKREVLSRIHVARAFTEYQMDALVGNLEEALPRWHPSVLAVSYFPTLFSGADGGRLFEPLLSRLKSLTCASGIITAVTSFGGSWHCDRLLASSADRVIRIDERKKLIRINDDGHVLEYVPVPPGQRRFADFAGGDAYGQDSAIISHPA